MEKLVGGITDPAAVSAINNALKGDMAGLAALVKNPAAAPALKELLGVLAGGSAGGAYAVLEKNNPRFATLLKENPGLGKFLANNTVAGEKGPGEVDTKLNWSLWTHSEKTGKHYGHGMSDAQILSDFVVAMQPSKDPKAKVTFGYQSFPGYEVIGVYQTKDQVQWKSGGSDGGHLGRFDLTAHGKAGDQAVVAWSIVSIGDDGRVKGGGYPTSRGGKIVPHQDQGAGGTSSGGEYWGRATRVTHGQSQYVPLTAN